jgi:hypothetical protein
MKPKNTIRLWFDKDELEATPPAHLVPAGVFFPPSEPALN